MDLHVKRSGRDLAQVDEDLTKRWSQLAKAFASLRTGRRKTGTMNYEGSNETKRSPRRNYDS
jgi:hypothetical protein